MAVEVPVEVAEDVTDETEEDPEREGSIVHSPDSSSWDGCVLHLLEASDLSRDLVGGFSHTVHLAL